MSESSAAPREHPAATLTGGRVPAHVPGAYPRLSCCGGTVELVPADDIRDRLAATLAQGACPLCRSQLAVERPRYGWGSMGAGVRCPSCGLRLRAAWTPLRRAVVKVAAKRRAR
jgi:hypothetical protein